MKIFKALILMLILFSSAALMYHTQRMDEPPEIIISAGDLQVG